MNASYRPSQKQPGSEDRSVVRAAIRRLAERVSMIVWEADTEGRCTYLNPEAARAFSSPADVHIDDWFAHIHPEDAPGVIAKIQE
ncbi:MAG TPA: PAS domain-containing protein, partial [Noviherbaspirillum sp.]